MQQTLVQNITSENNQEDIIVYNIQEVEYLRSQKGGKYKTCYTYCQQCRLKYKTVVNRLYLSGFVCKNCKISNTKKNTSKEVKDDIQKKRKKTCLEKYGVDNVFKVESVKRKSKETLKEKYNVTNAQQLQFKKDYSPKKQLKEKLEIPKIDKQKHLEDLKDLKLTKWETRTEQETRDIVRKREKTFLEKYGVKTAIQLPKFKEKNKTNMFI